MDLEQRTRYRNLGRGFATGAANVIDLFGGIINYVDLNLVGVGYANRDRVISTASSEIHKVVLPNPERELNFRRDYVPRFLGQLGGMATGVGTLYAAGKASASTIAPYIPAAVATGISNWGAATAASLGKIPVIGSATGSAVLGATSLSAVPVVVGALAIPAVLGVYAVGSAMYKYTRDFVQGERTGKASFMDGYRYGWQVGSFTFPLFGQIPIFERFLSPVRYRHDLETALRGSDYQDSQFQSPISRAARKMRRNLASIGGAVAGAAVGIAANVLTLGVFSIYKNYRHWNAYRHGRRRRAMYRIQPRRAVA